MMFGFRDKKKKEETVASIISISKITSIQQISEISEISSEEVCTIIEKLIAKSKNDSQYKLFRKAYIDKQANEVVIEKFAKGGGLLSIKDKLSPSSILKADWKCTFCGATNKGKNTKCHSCAAVNS